MDHTIVPSLISGDAYDLTTGGVHKDDKHESQMLSSKKQTHASILYRDKQGKPKENKIYTQKNRFNHDKYIALPIHIETANGSPEKQLRMGIKPCKNERIISYNSIPGKLSLSEELLLSFKDFLNSSFPQLLFSFVTTPEKKVSL